MRLLGAGAPDCAALPWRAAEYGKAEIL